MVVAIIDTEVIDSRRGSDEKKGIARPLLNVTVHQLGGNNTLRSASAHGETDIVAVRVRPEVRIRRQGQFQDNGDANILGRNGEGKGAHIVPILQCIHKVLTGRGSEHSIGDENKTKGKGDIATVSVHRGKWK